MVFKYPWQILVYFRVDVLTLNLQVFLCLEVLDSRVVYDANNRYTIILLIHRECQPAGYRIHLVIGQLDLWLPYGKQKQTNLSNSDIDTL